MNPRPPIGAAVRQTEAGPLGRVVRLPAAELIRGCTPVCFDGETTPRQVQTATLRYVARRMHTARAWRPLP